MGGSELVLFHIDGAVATITLNRPDKLNALVADMRDRLLDCLYVAEQDPDIRVLVITGAGSAFCAGGDIEFMRQMLAEQRHHDLHELLTLGGRFVQAIRGSRLPIVASVNGVAAGAGLNLALACDIRIASQAASFAESFVRVGLHPDWGGTFFLPRLVGTSRAMRMMMTGVPVGALEALEIGLVDHLVAPDTLAVETRKLADRLAAGPPLAIARIKEAIYMSHDSDLQTMLDFEEAAQMACFQSADAQEGMAAFLEKRAPIFAGH